MTRVISGLSILLVVVGTVWFLPPWATLVLALIALGLAAPEFGALAAHRGHTVPPSLLVVLAAATCFSVAVPGVHVEMTLLAALVVVVAVTVGTARPDDDVVGRAAVPLMAALYLGLPVGALVAVRTQFGPEAVLLALLTVVASDTAQFYGGRMFGRHKLAPILSPKKTVEGAVSGLIAGSAVLTSFGLWWLPGLSSWWLAALGAVLALLGILGDLFESLLKRSAGVKDASGLIPGHGGMLDRIDSLLLVAPVYYVVLMHLTALP